jgi:hypothetical protein
MFWLLPFCPALDIDLLRHPLSEMSENQTTIVMDEIILVVMADKLKFQLFLVLGSNLTTD